jgi:hypothetical protein
MAAERRMSSLSLIKTEKLDHRLEKRAMRRWGRAAHFSPVIGALIGWIVIAAAVYALDVASRGSSGNVSANDAEIGKVVLIVAGAGFFARAMRGISVETAFATGIAWLALAIAGEALLGIRSGSDWSEFLGNPKTVSEVLRDATMIAWVAAPALFARRVEPKEQTRLRPSGRTR